MTNIVLPKTNQTGANEWADVEDNDNAIAAVVNGALDNGNLAAAAAIVDTKLASPNNALWKTVFQASGNLRDTAYNAPLGFGDPLSLAFSSVALIPLDPTDYTVAAKTTQWRLSAAAMVGSTAPGTSVGVSVYGLASPAANAVVFGSAVGGSGVDFHATPSADTGYRSASSAFTMSGAGVFVIRGGVGAAPAVGTQVGITALLQVRHI